MEKQTNDKAFLAMLIALAAMLATPTALAEDTPLDDGIETLTDDDPENDQLCYHDDPVDPYGDHDEGGRNCIVDQAPTGGHCFVSEYNEEVNGPYNDEPVSYDGSQSCVVNVEPDGSTCFGYSWEYANYGGHKYGSRTQFTCDGPLGAPMLM